ncbi:prenyltransferase [Thermococcus celer]|uniref:Prenyltransferase n=1 Tax=Thermococcus celer Vu 13 = JCM 8558 TaxID=1293037 RepID=A0A218P2C2_THECE|nr:prenyltransferase [Thermococcus celer]ASI99058.1 prenyltransferase [Thermococcus celer] [Thermococcus celer Vu 13 = JCM 8558]
MLVKEVLASVDVIPDPYIKSATYAKIGERLARAKNNLYKTAFLRAVETANEIEDPVTMFRALLSVGYSMEKAGLKSGKRIYRSVLEDSRMLPAPQRDLLMQSAATYLLALGDVNEAVTYALEIANPEVRNETLLEALRVNTRMIEKERLKVAYRLRKSKLIVDSIDSEPQRSKAMLELIKAYLLMESYENAISLLKEINTKDWARQAFKEVAFYLKDKGTLGHYVDTLEAAANALIEKFGNDFRVELAFVFALSGEGVPAIELIRSLKDGEKVLVDMALELLERDHDVLPNFISAMNEEEATVVGKAVMNRILERPEKGDPAIIKAIGNGTTSEEVWTKIARYYVIRGELEGAVRIANLIRDGRLRSIIMTDVAHHLLKEGEVEKAIDAALEVRDPRFSSILVSEILIKALGEGLRGRVKSWNGSKR